MPIEPITTVGVILKRFSDHVFSIRLPNGKEIVGHLPKALEELKEELVPDIEVTLEMTPYDFEKARISNILK